MDRAYKAIYKQAGAEQCQAEINWPLLAAICFNMDEDQGLVWLKIQNYSDKENLQT